MGKYKQVGYHLMDESGRVHFYTDIDPGTGDVVCSICAGVLIGGGIPCDCDERSQGWIFPSCPECNGLNVEWDYGEPEVGVYETWRCLDCGIEFDDAAAQDGGGSDAE